jgi:glyoxylase I family protein
MAIRGNRIYHVNSNCSDLDRSVLFYEALGLTRVLRTVPSRAQSGLAFGLDEVSWDAWMMHSDDGMGGLSLDLLEWKIPSPIGIPPSTTGEPGFNRLVVATADLDGAITKALDSGGTLVGGPVRVATDGVSGRVAMMLDPDGVAVQLVEGDRTSIVQVVVNCADIEESLTYYRDVMGLRPFGPVETVSQPAKLHGLDHDGLMKSVVLADAGSVFTVALVEWIDPCVRVETRVPSANELGLFRMAWSTEDCAHDEEIVRAAGSVPFAPTGELSVGDNLPLLLVLFWPGPNGECLEVIEVTGRSGAL